MDRVPLFRSLYGRISGLYLLLALGLCLLGAWVAVWHFSEFVNEVEQKLNRNMAMKLGAALAPLLEAGDYNAALAHADEQATMFFPALELYVLDAGGAILARVPATDSLVETRIPVEPLRAFAREDAALPIWGANPIDPSTPKVFSSTPVELADGRDGYLYIILRGEAAGSAAGMVQNSYILRSLPLYLGLVLGFTVVVGLLLFAWLTRRSRRLIASVHRFKAGDYGQRVDVGGRDEIGQLGRAFNEMAATIEAQVDALRQSDAERRAVVANISHDFRTPLTAIRGRAERLRSFGDGMPSDARAANLDEILHNTERLERLAQHLNALSKLDARSRRPRMEPFRIAELVQDVLVGLRPLADAWSLTLAADIAPDVGYVEADISLIERLLVNLISNALENTPSGGAVTVTVEGRGDRVRMCVEDTGRGIPADALALVRQRFYRLDRPPLHRTDGSGLGLSIAHEIAELHGTALEIASAEQRGTTVACHLKARTTAPLPAPVETSPP